MLLICYLVAVTTVSTPLIRFLSIFEVRNGSGLSIFGRQLDR